MARLWDVLKAIHENPRLKGVRTSKGTATGIAELIINDGQTYKGDGKDLLAFQGFSADDFNFDWNIFARKEMVTYDFLLVVSEISRNSLGDIESSVEEEIFKETSLLKAQEHLEREFKDSEVLTLSAVGVMESGETTILITEGVRVGG